MNDQEIARGELDGHYFQRHACRIVSKIHQPRGAGRGTTGRRRLFEAQAAMFDDVRDPQARDAMLPGRPSEPHPHPESLPFCPTELARLSPAERGCTAALAPGRRLRGVVGRAAPVRGAHRKPGQFHPAITGGVLSAGSDGHAAERNDRRSSQLVNQNSAARRWPVVVRGWQRQRLHRRHEQQRHQEVQTLSRASGSDQSSGWGTSICS